VGKGWKGDRKRDRRNEKGTEAAWERDGIRMEKEQKRDGKKTEEGW
jgi:hypothetical protein